MGALYITRADMIAEMVIFLEPADAGVAREIYEEVLQGAQKQVDAALLGRYGTGHDDQPVVTESARAAMRAKGIL